MPLWALLLALLNRSKAASAQQLKNLFVSIMVWFRWAHLIIITWKNLLYCSTYITNIYVYNNDDSLWPWCISNRTCLKTCSSITNNSEIVFPLLQPDWENAYYIFVRCPHSHYHNLKKNASLPYRWSVLDLTARNNPK